MQATVSSFQFGSWKVPECISCAIIPTRGRIGEHNEPGFNVVLCLEKPGTLFLSVAETTKLHIRAVGAVQTVR